MDAQRELVINPDERAVDACLVSQAGSAEPVQANVSFFEPQTISDLARQGRLYVLAEGVGGSFSGSVASQYALQKVIHGFYTAPTPDPKARLLTAIRQANADIFERNQRYPDRRPLVTTLAAALIHNNKLLVASVGDNRVYVVWDQDIELLTPAKAAPAPVDAPAPPAVPTEPNNDDLPAADNAPAPATAAVRSLVPVGLGLAAEVEINTSMRRLFAGDVVILSNGGLTGYLQDAEVARAVNLHQGEPAIRRLIALAAERGYHDSCAIGVVRVLPELISARPPAVLPRPVAPSWDKLDQPAEPAILAASKTGQTKTRPLGETPAKPQFKRPPDFMPAEKWWLNPKLIIALAVVALLVGCGILFVAARWLIPPPIMAMLPLAEQVGLVAGTPEPQITYLPTSTPTVTITPTPAPQITPPAHSQPPIATPTANMVNPVSPVRPSASKSDTVSPVPTPSPTPLPLPTVVLPKGCQTKGRFVRDITVPDGTQIAAGEKFDKVWLLLNAADCPWGPGYTIRLVDGEAMGAPNIINVRTRTEPDANFEARVSLVAPASPGVHRGVWQLHDLTGQPFGPELYLEIEVTPAAAGSKTNTGHTQVLYDFVANAASGQWSSGNATYTVQQTPLSDALQLPPAGLVAVGVAQLRGNKTSDGNALLTYPHLENGYIEGKFKVDTPLQPTDTVAAELGFTKLSILSDDGVTFEMAFTPTGGTERVIFSKPVEYRTSPVTESQPLGDIPPGSTGTFTLRVRGGNSLSQDWAVWISARLLRP